MDNRTGSRSAKWFPWSLRLTSLLLASIALLLAMSGVATWNLRMQRIDGDSVAHSNRVRYELLQVLQLLTAAEDGAREFALIGSARALQVYREASTRLDPSLEQLRQLVSDNPKQQPLAAQLDALARDVEASNAALLAETRIGDMAQARAFISRGHLDDVMAAVRSLSARMQTEEDQLLIERRLTRDRARRDAALALWATGGMGAVLLVLIVYFTRRDEATLRRAERELATSLQLRDAELQVINEYARFPVARCDPQCRYLFVNRAYAQRLGFTPEQCVGRHVREIAGEQAYERVLPYIEKALAGHVAEFETEIPYAGIRGARWMRCIYAPVLDQGNVTSFVAAVTDITERKVAELELQRSQAALEEADRRKDEFIATLSHELRNPLAPIRTAAKLLASPDLKPAQLQRVQMIIERQVTHMALLLDDLLDIARITQGKFQLKKEPVDLVEVVDAAIEAARPKIDAKEHQLSVALPSEPITLEADPVRLSQILTNLVTNAAKYSDPGGSIVLRATIQDDTLSLSVKDEGIGIAPEDLTGIFDMFSQVEGVLGRSDGGLGIGLALVKGLVQLHGGSVHVHSAGLGHGSEFIVRLPIAAGFPVRSETRCKKLPTASSDVRQFKAVDPAG